MSLRSEGMRLRTRIAAIVGTAAFLVLAGTGAGYAYWTASSAVAASAQSTGATVALTVPTALTTTYTSSSTGPVIGALTLANTGGAPLGLALTAGSTNASLSGAISLRLWLQTGGNCGTTVPASGVTTGTLAAPPALPAGATSAAAGASVVVCAATAFTGTYATFAGQSTTVTLTLTGSVGTAWRPTATGSFTQSLANSVPSFTCTNNGGNITITWANTATANTTTKYRSRINGVLATGLSDRDFYYQSYSNQSISGTGLPNAAGVYTWNIEETTNGVTTVAYTGNVEVYYYTAWNAWSLRCA